MYDQDTIIKEVIDLCSNMGEPERTEYLKNHFQITRIAEPSAYRISLEKAIQKRLFRDPQIPNSCKEYNVE